MDRRTFIASTGIGLLGLISTACTPSRSTRTVPSAPAAPTGRFYPPLPAAPRIQHLTTYASERDVVPQKKDFASFIAGEASQETRLIQPYGATLHEGQLYVADTGAAGIAVFDIAHAGFHTITGTGGGGMVKPINITIDDDGTKYVCDTGRNQVLVYDAQDRFLRALGSPKLFKPVDCVIVEQGLFVTDVANHRIHHLNKMSGELLGGFGKPGSGAGELFHPTNLALGPQGDLYVVETSNFRVQRFTRDGESLRTYGHIGDTPGSFARPKGIAIDHAGRLFVGDSAFQNVQIFANNGQLLLDFGKPQGTWEGLNLPAGISIDYRNVGLFQRFAAPGFHLEFVILVVSQFGPNKVDVFGFGKLDGADYDAPAEISGSASGQRATALANVASHRPHLA